VLNRLKTHTFFSKIRTRETLLVSALVTLAFSFYLWVFSRNLLITGVDGPYYLIQIRSLLETGGLTYGDPPLTFYLLTFFTLLAGDITLGVKIGVSLLCALSTVPVFYVMKRLGGFSAGLLAMLLIVFSAPYLRMMTDFMKNAIGVCWLLGFTYYLHDLVFTGFTKKSLALATCLLLLTGLTHILAFAVALLFLCAYTATALVQGLDRRPILKTELVLASATLIFIVVTATFFGPLFTDFTKIFSFISALTQPRPLQPLPQQPPLPGPKPQPFGPSIADSLSIIGGYGIVLITLACGACFSYIAWKQADREASTLLAAVTISFTAISLPIIPNEWLNRFLLMFVIPTAIIVSYSIPRITTLLNPTTKPTILIILGGITLVLFATQAITIATRLNPTIGPVQYQDLADMKSRIPTNSIIVASPQGAHYWTQYITDADVGPLSPTTYQSYSHVFIIFEKSQPPPILQITRHTIIYVGKAYALAELRSP